MNSVTLLLIPYLSVHGWIWCKCLIIDDTYTILQVSSGEGAIDTERLFVGLPADLGIDSEKAKKLGQSIAKDKTRVILVQVFPSFLFVL